MKIKTVNIENDSFRELGDLSSRQRKTQGRILHDAVADLAIVIPPLPDTLEPHRNAAIGQDLFGFPYCILSKMKNAGG